MSRWNFSEFVSVRNFIARYCRFMISGSISVENAPTSLLPFQDFLSFQPFQFASRLSIEEKKWIDLELTRLETSISVTFHFSSPIRGIKLIETRYRENLLQLARRPTKSTYYALEKRRETIDLGSLRDFE